MTSKQTAFGTKLAIAGFLAACLPFFVAPVSGCSKNAKVQLPDGFQGQVRLTCSDAPLHAGVVAHDGTGTLVCGNKQESFDVMRHGQSVAVTNLQWQQTGDGYVTGVRFTVPQ